MDKFRFGIDQVDIAGRQDIILETGEDRCRHLLRGADDGKPKQCPLPEVLAADFGTADRKAVAAASQQFLQHAALLLEVLRPVQAKIQLQYTDHHLRNSPVRPDCARSAGLQGRFEFLDLIGLDDVTGLDVVVILQANAALVVGGDFFDIILETTQ